jgi:hypothetical protein
MINESIFWTILMVAVVAVVAVVTNVPEVVYLEQRLQLKAVVD